MVEILLIVGLVVAVFVGFNIGGATTGPAFGPAVGSDSISKAGAAALMAIFFFLGAYTIGPEVINTLGRELITEGETAVFTLESSIVVLFFIGGALFVGNYFGVPASTSMTAVGAIAGLGVATGRLNWAEMGAIAVWWIVAPIIGFWVSGMIGRYFYPTINRWVAVNASDGPLVEIDRAGAIPKPVRGPGTTTRELVGAFVVVSIGCLMAFSSGASNIANAIAPLVGADLDLTDSVAATLGTDFGLTDVTLLIIIGCIAVAIGAFTIARRTLDTLGNDITDLPLTAAIVVAVVSSIIVIGLSAIGIPASFVIIATTSIVGLGWGRATRTTPLQDVVKKDEETPDITVGALAAEEAGEEVPEIGEEESSDIPSASDLFNPATTSRVIVMQNVVPIIATVGAYATFFVLFQFVW